MKLPYNDEITFYKVTSDSYGQNKIVSEYSVVPSIFLQGTVLSQNNNEETISADATCYPDPTNDFVIDNSNRLEGMYIYTGLFGDTSSWYRVVRAIVNRDHLLTNEIDNIQLFLKKSTALQNVS